MIIKFNSGPVDAKPPSGTVAQRMQQFETQPDSTSRKPPPKPSWESNVVPPKPQISQTAVTTAPSPFAAAGKAPTARPRPKATTTQDVIARLQAICNPADPTRLYRNLIKIGQG